MTTSSVSSPEATRTATPHRGWWGLVGFLSLIWLGINGMDWSSWWVGGPAVLLAAWVSWKLSPVQPWRWTLSGAMGFAWFFLSESVRGGWDVAWRALAPRGRLAPGLVIHRWRLPEGPARRFFCAVVSLLPGTAVVEMLEDRVRVHVLEVTSEREPELERLEERVAALFGLRLAAASGKEGGG